MSCSVKVISDVIILDVGGIFVVVVVVLAAVLDVVCDTGHIVAVVGGVNAI